MALNSTMLAAISGSNIRTFYAVRIELDGYTINVIDGAGFVKFPVNGVTTLFDHADPVYGFLGGISSINESITTSAPSISIGFLPPQATAVGQMMQPTYQGSPVYVWFGLIDDATGLVIGTPELLWTGRVDVGTEDFEGTERLMTFDVVSVFDRLFITGEGERINDGWHQSIWPGETGLSKNIEAMLDPTWGAEVGRPSGSNGSGGTGSGGGGAGGPDLQGWTRSVTGSMVRD